MNSKYPKLGVNMNATHINSAASTSAEDAKTVAVASRETNRADANSQSAGKRRESFFFALMRVLAGVSF
jgi:hypothetical protein